MRHGRKAHLVLGLALVLAACAGDGNGVRSNDSVSAARDAVADSGSTGADRPPPLEPLPAAQSPQSAKVENDANGWENSRSRPGLDWFQSLHLAPPEHGRREAFTAALAERRQDHDQDLWSRLNRYDDARRRSEVLAELLAVQGDQGVVTALDWIMDRLYGGKGSSAYLAAYALLLDRAGFPEGAVWGDLMARLRIAEDAARCAYLPAARDKMLMIRQLLAPLTVPLEGIEPEVEAELAAQVYAESRNLPRNRQDAWLCRGGPNYTTEYFRKHGARPDMKALRIETQRQTMVLLPDDPEIETGGFRDDADWESAIAGLRNGFRERYGLAR